MKKFSSEAVVGRFPGMRKDQTFIVYPLISDTASHVVIQSDKRIALVNLATGLTTLSDGKGGHQDSEKLTDHGGAKRVPMPEDMLASLRQVVENYKAAGGVGAVRVM